MKTRVQTVTKLTHRQQKRCLKSVTELISKVVGSLIWGHDKPFLFLDLREGCPKQPSQWYRTGRGLPWVARRPWSRLKKASYKADFSTLSGGRGGGGCRYKKRGGGECATESPESLSKLSLVLIAPTAEARLGSWIALLCWPWRPQAYIITALHAPS